ncbi:Swt1 family HEPN domain-containing protein [Actinopolymorpha sp. B9G3]|uniref:Swt1 family HEPN domain-containing protein n=1 Tax=Actinopolymorpha sp. B9G3 TaxID=3158970 RepID=UPI0032D9A7C7
MATSNRDRIERGLTLLSAGLDPFIENALSDRVPTGKDWTLVLATKDAGNGTSRSYDRTDVQNQLRVLTENLAPGWFPFDNHLSRAEKSLASELREVRNQWAHQKPFTADDTYRALDTTERLLRAANAVAQADEVRAIRIDLQRREFESEVARTSRAQTSLPGLESQGLPAWSDVLTPHPDIAAGRYAASEFAADLHEVAGGRGEAEYSDPVEFFRRTFLTEGLRQLLTRATARLSGDTAADPVINLQTNFGGGKTHSMLAVWHLVSGHHARDYPQEVQELLSGTDVSGWDRTVRRVALVGNEIPPGQPMRKADGTEVNTLWGELAWQLGGREAYDLVAGSDASASNPGALLKDLLARYGPCVILIDEWVAYARGLYARDDLCGGTFETQFTFAQTLTEAVAATPGALLLVSVPASDVRQEAGGRDASDLEIGGAHGRQALERLQNVIGRTSYEWRPASSQESFEIVRRRLFSDPDGTARTRIGSVAKAFVEFYRRSRGEFPRETLDSDYERRIRIAYPIHPELFDRLYTDWSSLEKFQRTRGVLRLMSSVVHSLYTNGDKSPLIMPGSIPLDAIGVRDEIAKYLDDNWKPIVDSDVDGGDSVPARVDAERPLFGTRALSRRIARALFLGSAATLRSAHKGIERHRLFLGVAQPGDTVGNFGSALQLLSDRATFLYSEGDRYWYDTQPSLNRKAAEKAESLTPEDVWAELVERLNRVERVRPGHFVDVVVAPSSTAEVGEPDGVRLVILHPRFTHSAKNAASDAAEFASRLMTERGTAPRERRNLLIALAADTQRYAELESAVRQHLAWRDMAGRITELDLTQQNEAMVNRRRDETSRVVDQRIPTTFIWTFHPAQPDGAKPLETKALKVDGNDTGLAVRTANRLVKEQLLLTGLGVQNVRLALDQRLRARWNDGRITVGALWDYYRRYPYLDRLRNRRVLDEAVAAALDEMEWHGGGFALATNYDDATGEFTGLALPNTSDTFGPVTDKTLLVAPHLALAQRERESTLHDEQGDVDDVGIGQQPGTGARSRTPQTPNQPEVQALEPVRNVRYRARLTVDASADIAAQLRDATQELLDHLKAADPDALDITLEIDATRLEGFDERTVRTVTENGTTLGFADNRFRDDG